MANVCIREKKYIIDFNWLAVGMASRCKIFQLQIKLVQLIQRYQEVKLKMCLVLVKMASIGIISNISPQFASKFQILQKICVYWISSFYLKI